MNEHKQLDYDALLEVFEQASTFDLYRLDTVLRNMLDDPKRIIHIRKQLRIGQTVSYFDSDDNREYTGTVIKCGPKNVSVQLPGTGKVWLLPYFMLNLDSRPVELSENDQTGLTRQQLAIGELVGFRDKEQQERVGKIVRLNEKTVTLNCDGNKWRVGYSLLYRFIEGEAGSPTGRLESP